MTGLAVVVVNHDTRDLLRACLLSALGQEAEEVVVVDNASRDGSAEMVRRELPEVRLLANPHNPGYGAAANQGIAACRAPYALLLNSDTLLGPGALETLARHLDDHPRAAVAGPRLRNPDGSHQPSCFPFLTPFNVLALNTCLNRPVRLLPGLGRRFLPTFRGTPARQGFWVKGAAMAFRRSAFAAAGGFDEGYFLYAEEMDLCLRLIAAGWEVHYAPEASVAHAEGASTMQARAEMIAQLFASLERFYRRHYPPGSLRRLRAAVAAIMVERIARDTVKLCLHPECRGRLAGDLLLWRRLLAERLPL